MEVSTAKIPRIAIVGRPNVGKSTLFNRLVGRRQSIVHDQPGVTRDRVVGTIELAPDRAGEVIDTGGLLTQEDILGLNQQVLFAVEEADLVLLVVDGTSGPVSADEQVVARIRPYGKPTLLVVNKGDTREAQSRVSEFYVLGCGEPFLVSAEHGRGLNDLREALAAALPGEALVAVETSAAHVAIVGRPNVGKSSLLNRILGAPRVLVSPVPGTTRDPIDTPLEHEGTSYVLIDTAGIRRRSQVTGPAEEIAVMMAKRSIERAQVAVLVVDAAMGVTSGDLAVAGAIWEAGRAAVVAVNKWDLLDGEQRERLELTWPRLAELLADPPRVNVSALTGRGVAKLFPAIDKALSGYRFKLGTGEVNRFFERTAEQVKAPTDRSGQPWKLFYATQVTTGPPTFMLFANRVLAKQDSYRRYLVNRLREAYHLEGIPVRLVVRKR